MNNIYKILLIGLTVACATVAVLFQQHILSLPNYFVGLDTLLIVLCSAITLACVFGLWHNYNNQIVIFNRDKHEKIKDLFHLKDCDINFSMVRNICTRLDSQQDIEKMTLDLFSEWAKQKDIPNLPEKFHEPSFKNITQFMAIIFALKNNKLDFSGMSKEVKQKFRGADAFINNAYQLIEKISISNRSEPLWLQIDPWQEFAQKLSDIIDYSIMNPLLYNKKDIAADFFYNKEEIFPLLENLWESGLYELFKDAKKVKIYQSQPFGLQLLLLFLALSFTLIPVLIKTQVILIPQYLFSIDLVLAVTAAIIATTAIFFLTWPTLFPSMTTMEINSTLMTSTKIAEIDKKCLFISNLITNISVYAVGTEEYFNQMVEFSTEHNLGLKPLPNNDKKIDKKIDKKNALTMEFFGIWKLIALIQDGKIRFQGLSKEFFDKFNVYKKDCFVKFKKILIASKQSNQEFEVGSNVRLIHDSLLRIPNFDEDPLDHQKKLAELIDPLTECLENASAIDVIEPRF